MSIATRTGDQGETSLLFHRRLSKAETRVECLGSIDELNAHLGMARATNTLPLIRESILHIQHHLVTLMGELAVHPQDQQKYAESSLTPFPSCALDELDQLIAQLENQNITFQGWVMPGESLASATLDMARTACRRAERRVVALTNSSQPEHPLALAYLNRLSDLLWLMARLQEIREKQEKS